MARNDPPSIVWPAAYCLAVLLVIGCLRRAERKAGEAQEDGEIVPPPDSPMYSQE
jgi:hypothetical protein